VTTFNISGLVSGIDTSSVIDQLMTVAAAPQTALQNNVASDQAEVSALQTINTKMAAVKSAADTLAQASTWAATTATASDSSIVASGSATALAGTSTTFSVTQIARAQVSTASFTDANNAADAASGIQISVNGAQAVQVDLSGNSINDVASAINSGGLGLRASVVNTTNGTILQLSSTSTGAASAFTVTGLTGANLNTISTAQDAQITVGTTAGSYTVASSTNTFTDAIPGVTFTVSKPVTDATISVATDSKSISDAVSSLVSAANDALSTISSATAQGAVLSGNVQVNSLTQVLLGVVSAGASGSRSYSAAGIGLTSSGQLTFDADAFAAAYASDPSGVQSMLQTTLATGFSAAGAGASDPTTGSVTALINGDNDEITSLNKQIADWQTRLDQQKTDLQSKYAAMEAALSKLKSQSSYLTSVFNAMSGNSSSSSSSTSSGTSSS
jgi:flagellar hook-associated protein 2